MIRPAPIRAVTVRQPAALSGEEHGRGEQGAAEGGQQAHGHVGHAGLDVVLADLLEVELAVEAGEPAGERDEELSKGRGARP